MKKTIFVIGLFLLCSLFLVGAETMDVECTSNKDCKNLNEYCNDWKCESKPMLDPTIVSTNTPPDYSSGLTFIVWIGVAIFALLIVIVYLLLRKRKNKE